MELAIKENKKKPDASAKELVPEDLHDSLDVFDEEQAGRLPKLQPWDHRIEIKGRIRTEIFQKLQSYTGGTNGTRQILEGKPGQRLYSSIAIPNGFTILLCKQERWEIATMPRLSLS